MSGGNDISSWSEVIKGSESVSGGQPEGGCPLKVSKALVRGHLGWCLVSIEGLFY